MQETASTHGASLPRWFLFTATAVAAAVLVAMFVDFVPDAGLAPLVVGLGSAALIVVAGAVYLLAPLFSAAERARARAAYGTHRDVLANGVTAVAIGQLVFLPILLLALSLAMHGQDGPAAIWTGLLRLFQAAQPMVLFLALVGLDLAFILVVHLRLVRTGATSWTDLGLVGTRFWRNIGLGFVGWLVLLVAVVVIRLPFASFTEVKPQEELGVITQAAPAVFSLFFVAGSLLAPFTEELFFRGYVFKSYLLRKGVGRAYLLSAIAFALPHTQAFSADPVQLIVQNIPLWAPVIAMGVVLANLLHRSGSLVAPVTAHALNNAVALLAAYFVLPSLQ